jgi:predicted DCC family thiol-disulfide oxidoreductase YuxK
VFFDLILCQFAFFELDRLPRAVGKWVGSARGWIELLYDGLCPLCRRTVRVLRRVDAFDRLECIDFRNLDLSHYNRGHGLNLTLPALEEEMVVVSGGRAYAGFWGYRVIALALPLFWPVAPALFVPGISVVGAMVYRRVATNRFKPLKCGPQCGVDPSGSEDSTNVTTVKAHARPSVWAIAVSTLAITMVFSWSHRIEFYPLTAWQMYSTSNVSGRIVYVKLLAHHDSGETSPASFDESGRSRLRGVFRRCFASSGARQLCKKLLAAIGFVHNAEARPGQRLDQLELQRWMWDFRSKPTDYAYGTLVDRLLVSVGR